MNELYTRYASPEMQEIWDPKTKVMIARGIWVAVMRAQKVAPDVVADYHAQMRSVDMESIRKREEVTGHETKAWLEEYNALAGHQAAHHGLTSSDITENVTAWQVHSAVVHLMAMTVSLGVRLGSLTGLYGDVPMVARTHNLPAQVTTLGRRFAMCLQELMVAFNDMGHFRHFQGQRGLKGAVGTAADLLRTMGGDERRVLDLEGDIARINDLNGHWLVTGQTPPRGQEAIIAATIASLCAGPVSLATTIRLMVGQGLATERPPAGTTGSSAMAHKVNPRFAERVCGLQIVVRGFANMLLNMAGGTWNEGDVMDSSARRIALPGLFLAADGLLRSAMIMLDRFDPDLAAIERELNDNRAWLKSGALLDRLVQRGCPREDAHAILRGWYGSGDSEIYQWITSDKIHEILGGEWDLGMTKMQVDMVLSWVGHHAQNSPAAAAYEPGAML